MALHRESCTINSVCCKPLHSQWVSIKVSTLNSRKSKTATLEGGVVRAMNEHLTHTHTPLEGCTCLTHAGIGWLAGWLAGIEKPNPPMTGIPFARVPNSITTRKKKLQNAHTSLGYVCTSSSGFNIYK